MAVSPESDLRSKESLSSGMKPKNLILRLPKMQRVIRRDLWLKSISDAGSHAGQKAQGSLMPMGMSYFDSEATLKYLLEHVEVVLTDYGRCG